MIITIVTSITGGVIVVTMVMLVCQSRRAIGIALAARRIGILDDPGRRWMPQVNCSAMKPQLLTLALDTPLENLLGLPNGVEIAYSLRSELACYSSAQLHDILAAIDSLVATEHQTFRSIPGYADEDILATRELNRDIDWLDDAIRFQSPPGSTTK